MKQNATIECWILCQLFILVKNAVPSTYTYSYNVSWDIYNYVLKVEKRENSSFLKFVKRQKVFVNKSNIRCEIRYRYSYTYCGVSMH